MCRVIFATSFLLAVALSAAALLTSSVHAAELQLSLGIRQTFPAGDLNGDLTIDETDLNIAENNFGLPGSYFQGDLNGDGEITAQDINILEPNLGAATSGVVGSDGGTTGPLFTTGSATLVADGLWHQVTITIPICTIGSSCSDWGVLESLRFANTTDGETKYKVWIDDLASTNSSGATVFGDFEAFNPGDEVIFQQPSVASGGDILPAPDVAEVTDGMAYSGSQSLVTEFEFNSDTPGLAAILSTADVANLPNPLIQLREGDYSQFTFTETTVTFWAKATVVPEPSSGVLMLLSVFFFLARRRQ